MDFTQARQDIEQWIVDFVEKPNPLLAGWPPCPYARQARLQNRIDIREGLRDPLELSLVQMQHFDVIAYVYDASQFTADSFNQAVDQLNQAYLVSRNMIALADHPEDHEEVNGVCMNQGTWAIVFLQDLDKLNAAAGQLAAKGFYHGWSEEYLTVLFRNRKDPR
jgi:hypothetical protein